MVLTLLVKDFELDFMCVLILETAQHMARRMLIAR